MPLTFQPVFRFKGHRDSLYAFCDDLEEDCLLSAGGDGLIARWDKRSEGDARLVVKVPATVYCMLRLGQFLLIGTLEGGLHWVDLALNKEIKLYRWNEQAVFTLAAYEQGWLSGHADGRLLRWQTDGESAELTNIRHQENAPLRALALSGGLIAAGYSDHHIRLFNDDLKEINRLEGHENSVFSLLFLKEGKYLLSGSRDAHLHVWEVASGKLIERIPAHLFTINHLIEIPEYGLIASAGRDKSIKLWDSSSLELKKVVDYEKFPGLAHSHSVNRLYWDSKYSHLWSAGDDRLIIKHVLKEM